MMDHRLHECDLDVGITESHEIFMHSITSNNSIGVGK